MISTPAGTKNVAPAGTAPPRTSAATLATYLCGANWGSGGERFINAGDVLEQAMVVVPGLRREDEDRGRRRVDPRRVEERRRVDVAVAARDVREALAPPARVERGVVVDRGVRAERRGGAGHAREDDGLVLEDGVRLRTAVEHPKETTTHPVLGEVEPEARRGPFRGPPVWKSTTGLGGPDQT